MSNTAILINTPAATSSFFEKDKSPSAYVELAEGVYRIPIPWFFCFDVDDLNTIQYEYGEGDDELIAVTVPTTDVEKAQKNLFAARGLMERICTDREIGGGYWQKAVEDFTDFEYGFITLNHLDIVHFAAADEWNDKLFKQCFTRTEEAFSAIKHFSCYVETHLPYEVDTFYSSPGLPDQDRVNNSAAIDSGFLRPGNRFVVNSG